jgi:hypothetical protein
MVFKSTKPLKPDVKSAKRGAMTVYRFFCFQSPGARLITCTVVVIVSVSTSCICDEFEFEMMKVNGTRPQSWI